MQLAWQANQLSSPVTFTATIVQSERKFWKNLTLSLYPCKDESEDFIDKQEFIVRMDRRTLGRIENDDCPDQSTFLRMARFLLPGFNYKNGIFRCDNYSVTYNTVYDINNAFDMGVKDVRTPLWPEKLAMAFTERWKSRRIPISSDLVFVVESVNVFYNLTTLPDLPRIGEVTEEMRTVKAPDNGESGEFFKSLGVTTQTAEDFIVPTSTVNYFIKPTTESAPTSTTQPKPKFAPPETTTYVYLPEPTTIKPYLTNILPKPENNTKRITTRTAVTGEILTSSFKISTRNNEYLSYSEPHRQTSETTTSTGPPKPTTSLTNSLLPIHFDNKIETTTETYLIYTFLIILLIFVIVSILITYQLIEENTTEPWSAVFTPNRITPFGTTSNETNSSLTAYCNESLPSIPYETTGDIFSTKVSLARLNLFPPLEASDIASTVDFRNLDGDVSDIRSLNSESSFRYVLEINPEYCQDFDDDGYVSHKTESMCAFSTQL